MKDLFLSGRTSENVRNMKGLSLTLIFSVILAIITCLHENAFCQPAQDLDAQFMATDVGDLQVAFTDQSTPHVYYHQGT